MSLTTSHFVPFPRTEVWDWHTRNGAVARLTPPFSGLYPIAEAESLATGTTTFGLPGGLRWVARHDLVGYRSGHSFVDVCISAPIRKLAHWRHTHTFNDAPGGTVITDRIDTRLPSTVVEPMVAYRQHQLMADLEASRRIQHLFPPPEHKPVVAMTGSRGLLGRALTAYLRTLGITVIQLVRKNPKEGQRLWDPDYPPASLLDGVDALIHLAGEPIWGRFTPAHKEAIRSSRIQPTAKLADLVSHSSTCNTFIAASAIAYYGAECGVGQPAAESDEQGEGFLAQTVADWEAAGESQARVVNIRTGLILSGRGGTLPIFRGLASAGLGGRLASGTRALPWIAIDDLVDIYAHALLDNWSGPINAVAPEITTNQELSQTIGRCLNRPTLLTIPMLGPKLLLGSEGATELALADQRVTPARLLSRGHVFRYPTLADALAHELGAEQLAETRDA